MVFVRRGRVYWRAAFIQGNTVSALVSARGTDIRARGRVFVLTAFAKDRVFASADTCLLDTGRYIPPVALRPRLELALD